MNQSSYNIDFEKIEINKYISYKKELYEQVVAFIQCEQQKNEYNFNLLIDNLKKQSYKQYPCNFRCFLKFILYLSNYYHRTPDFFTKIEQILYYIIENQKDYINQELLLEYDIFNIFKENKRILLFLLTNKVITINETLYKEYFSPEKSRQNQYFDYFQPEINDFLKQETMKIEDIERFNRNRLIGENDKYIPTLIRNDSVEEFVEYHNKKNFQLSYYVETSIFETNTFLLTKDKISYIEYAAFFGSIKIFQYIYREGKNIDLDSSIWLFAIHSNNPDLIHLLEEYKIPTNDSFPQILKESIKCNHNNIAKYIYENYCKDIILFDKYCFHYYNYGLINEEHDCFIYDCSFNLLNLARYNYLTIVKILFQSSEFFSQGKIILLSFLFTKFA